MHINNLILKCNYTYSECVYRLMRDCDMQSKYLLSVVLVGALVFSGCAETPRHEQQGMVIGGILGGLLGSQVGSGDGRTAAIIVGTMAGSMIGGSVGRSMDDTDRLKAAHTLETVRTGVPSAWRNPDTGNQYTVVPTRTYESSAGPCREYSIDAMVG